METRANYVAVGGFVLVIVVAALLSVVWLIRLQFSQEFTLYDTYFHGSVSGLGKGAQVRFNGLEVGRVVDLSIDPHDSRQVVVTLEIKTGTTVTGSTTASLTTQGLTGAAYVELSSGDPASPPLVAHDGQRYPVIASRASAFEQVVNGAPEVINRLIVVADGLARLLDEQGIEALRGTLLNLNTISGTIAGRSGDIDAILGDGAKAAKQLSATVGTLDRTLGQLDTAMKTITVAGTDADALIGSAGGTVKRLDKVLNDADAILAENRPALRDFSQTGLTQLTQLLSETRSLVAGLTRVSNELERDPTRFLFGDRREGYKPR
ncbi:MAG TPA: MlaD family protein [Stellaceae bacterium]|nr:MlaD family protein [Stellaceae bacterium]